MKANILVVDDDERLRTLLKKYLEGEGFAVLTAAGADEARKIIAEKKPDIMIVDVMMPEESGIDMVKNFGKEIEIPVLMLTALGEAEDRIKGLENGADDYLTKPFEPRELSLRLKKLLGRHLKTKKSANVKFGNYNFNPENGELSKNGKLIRLTSTELELLTIFSLNANKSVSREKLSSSLNNISERSIDVQVTRLRRKIEDDPKAPLHLQTARGKGYILRI